MEYEKIKQLMEDMSNSKLTALNVDFPDGTKVSMKKENTDFVETIGKVDKKESTQGLVKAKEDAIHFVGNNLKEKLDPKCNIVKSPMVGTFYIKASPTESSYVEVGSEVNKGDTLCIIEAMKLMNEIESEFTGKIKEILLKDGDPVEYGTELFVISNE